MVCLVPLNHIDSPTHARICFPPPGSKRSLCVHASPFQPQSLPMLHPNTRWARPHHSRIPVSPIPALFLTSVVTPSGALGLETLLTPCGFLALPSRAFSACLHLPTYLKLPTPALTPHWSSILIIFYSA